MATVPIADEASTRATADHRAQILHYVPAAEENFTLETDGWLVAGASVIGPQHIASGAPRQDAMAVDAVGPVLIGCVCDGLGSQSRSHIGAHLVARTIIQELCAVYQTAREALADGASLRIDAVADLEANVIPAAVERAVHELDALMALEPGPGFATTLLGFVATRDEGLFFHVGDGAGLASHDSSIDSNQVVLSPPENGDFEDITYPVTLRPLGEHLRTTRFSSPKWIVLMTDGPAPFALAKGQSTLSANIFGPLVAFMQSPRGRTETGAFLARILADRRAADISGDDKTILIARLD